MDKWIQVETNEAVLRALELRKTDAAFLSQVFPSSPEQRLEFGTAGLRAEFGPGLLRMNEVIVMQTCQGILHQLLQDFGAEALNKRGICIGYDHRKSEEWGLSSKRFALVAAAVFMKHTKAIHLFDQVNPTPFVPFAVQHFNSLTGFMFTASHNPKQDAGFKVYWANACQITSPLDMEIRTRIVKHLQDRSLVEVMQQVKRQSEQELLAAYAQVGLHDEIQALYIAAVKSQLCRSLPPNNNKKRNICYTAMHGCGQNTALKLFAEFKIPNVVSVPTQAEPDFNFPTVKFPNPEERGALDVAMKYASQHQCELILANDPDADRLGCAEWNGKEWITLSGDEIAMLLAWWEIRNMDKKNGKPKAMVVSAVSSAFLHKMGSKHGVEVFEALTGFKWIGAKALELRSKGYDVLLSYEEAIGFCIGSTICDKDGMSAAAVFAQMYLHLQREEQTTCVAKLDALRREHGYFLTQNLYLKMDPASQLALFTQMRNGGKFASEVGRRKVARVRDLELRIDTLHPSEEPSLPFAANMITYFLDQGERITLRASGTEPKLKYYVECIGTSFEEAKQRCESVVRDVVLGDLLVLRSGL